MVRVGGHLTRSVARREVEATRSPRARTATVWVVQRASVLWWGAVSGETNPVASRLEGGDELCEAVAGLARRGAGPPALAAHCAPAVAR